MMPPHSANDWSSLAGDVGESPLFRKVVRGTTGIVWLMGYFEVPFLAFALFLMPCAGIGPPYFLPRIFLPRNLTFLPPMVYESSLSRALRPWLLQLANWLAPSWSSGTLLLHSFSGALASMISAILIWLFIWFCNTSVFCGEPHVRMRALSQEKLWFCYGSLVTICSETLDKWGFSVIIYTVTKALTGVTICKN